MKTTNRLKLLTFHIQTHLKVCATSLLIAQLVVSSPLHASPTGGNVVGGAGNINQSGSTTTINQNSQRLAIDWATFNVDRHESVNFNQPNQSSIALNRIQDLEPSHINGAINANGRLIFSNPNGMIFGENATVNAAGLFITTLKATDPDAFINTGKLNLEAVEGATGLIVNKGRLEVLDYAALILLGQQIRNENLLIARFGTVALAGGSNVTVQFNDSDINIQINENKLADILHLDNPQIINSGLIQAHGGNVILTATQASQIRTSVFKRDENRVFSFTNGTIVERNGEIFLAGPGGDISNIGNIDVSDNGNAGTVIFDARNINHSGKIYADSYTRGDAGNILINSTDTTLLTGDSLVSAQTDKSGKGGTVHILGNQVGLTDNAEINASGANGGGEVLIGGDYQGKNKGIKNAEAVYLGENTIIKADAKNNADGGKIIVWSDDRTRAYGSLSARGSGDGKGGFIETSSHNYVDLKTSVDVSAESGLSGQWLIDPSNINIGGLTNGVSPRPIPNDNIFQSTINASFLSVSTLEIALSAGADITVQTAPIFTACSIPGPGCTLDIDQQPEPGGGNITLSSPLNLDVMSGFGPRSLTLRAHDDITINADIGELTNNDGIEHLNLTLQADSNNNGGGTVTINSGRTIGLSGGNFTVLSSTDTFTNNGTITTDNSFNPGTEPNGDITINVSSTATLGNLTTDAGGGALVVTAGSINDGAADRILNIAGTSSFTSTGNINLNNIGNDFGGAVTVNNGAAVTLVDTNALTLGSINSNSLNASATDAISQLSATSISTSGNTALTSTANSIQHRNISSGSLTVNANTNITQATSTSLNITGTSNLIAGNNITLTQSNNLGSNIQLNAGNNATIVDTGVVNLGTSTVTGNLDVTSGGNITDTANLNVTGTATFNAPSGSDILLDSTGNSFNNTINFIINGAPGNFNNITLRDTAGAFTLQDNLNITGDLNLRANDITLNNFTLGNASTLTLIADNGNINQNNAITHNGTTILGASGGGNGNINFNLANNFGTVQINNATTATINNAANALALNNVSALDSNITATGGITANGIINVTNTATFDAGTNALNLNNNTHVLNNVQVSAAGNVQINEADDINISGTMASLSVTSGLSGASSTISNITDTALNVSGPTVLLLQNGGSVNLANFIGAQRNNLQGLINIGANAGVINNVSARNTADIQLAALNTSNDLSLDSSNNIIQSGGFTINGATSLQANNITLLQNNDFIGDVTLTDSNTVQLNDNNGGINIIAANTNASNSIDLNLTSVGTVGIEGTLLNASLTSSTGNIQSTTALSITNNTTLTTSATGNIDFQTNPVDLENVSIVQTNNVSINDSDNVTITNANVSGTMGITALGPVSVNGSINTLNINANNAITLSGILANLNAITTAGGIQNNANALTVSGITILDGANSNINLNHAGNDFNQLAIVSAQDVTLQDANNIILQDITARDFNLTTTGDITQSAGTIITSSRSANLDAGNASITLNNNNRFTALALNANTANVTNDQALTLNDTVLADSLTLTTLNGSLSVKQITAANTITLSAADALVDANGDGVINIISNSTNLNAVNGIGSTSSIDTQVTFLSASNSTSGDINIKNTGGTITLSNIINGATDTGNFNFESTNDVLIDNISLQQNLVEEFFNNGTGTANLFTFDGDFLGVGDADLTNADITATNLRVVGVRGNFGTLQRRMVLDISGKAEFLMRANLDPFFIAPAPAATDIQDNSIIQFAATNILSVLNGVTLTEVETLFDIDPAIFTAIRHFNVSPDPLMLPRDQLFEGGYSNDDDDEYFNSIVF